MNTTELLEKLNLSASEFKGFYVDNQSPKEFILTYFKDNGAERWRLYGDKENFCIALGSDTKHHILAACPVKDIIPQIKQMLSRGPDADRNLTAFVDFADKSPHLSAPEEKFSESAKEFLNGQPEKTMADEEIINVVNQFRDRSGYERTFTLASAPQPGNAVEKSEPSLSKFRP